MKLTINTIENVFKSKFATVETMQLKGYTLIENLFCDNSGFGAENEPAYTKSQFETRLREILAQYPTVYTTITDAGQFQVYIGVFVKTGKSTLEKIAGNTYSFYKENVYTIRYHDTDIIKMVNNTITLDNGGYYTNTTKERINAFIYSYGYTLFQKDFQWYVKNNNTNTVSDYSNGMILKIN